VGDRAVAEQRALFHLARAKEVDLEPEPFVTCPTSGESKRTFAPPPCTFAIEFAEFAFRMPRVTASATNDSRLRGGDTLRRIYEFAGRRIHSYFARAQVEKSTLAGTARSHPLVHGGVGIGRSTFRPRRRQTKTFSMDRIKDPMETSEVLRRHNDALAQNIFRNSHQPLANHAALCILNADRTRGIPAWRLCSTSSKIFSATISRSSSRHEPRARAVETPSSTPGTPKSLDNIIEYYRRAALTQGEWVVPAKRTGARRAL